MAQTETTRITAQRSAGKTTQTFDLVEIQRTIGTNMTAVIASRVRLVGTRDEWSSKDRVYLLKTDTIREAK